MKDRIAVVLIVLLAALAPRSLAQTTDTIDVVNYALHLDIGHQQTRKIAGRAEIDLQKVQQADYIRLSLANATVDSVTLNYSPVSLSGYSYDGRNLMVSTASVATNTVFTLEVFYTTPGKVEGYGWGGFHFDNTIYYNLGVAFSEYPHNYGRSWFPCNDNFTDKASYQFQITSPAGWTTTASGIRDTAYTNADNSETSHWTLSNPTPTYLVSVAVGPFSYHNQTIQSQYGTYPLIAAYRNSTPQAVAQAFDQMNQVVPMFERCFGPYRWGTIGYTGTTQGSMEHVNNISLINSAMTGMDQGNQGVMAHEFAHSWFGNLVTCTTSEDMWIQEGGASFCEEIAAEAVHGKEYGDGVYMKNLENVLRSTHITDNGFKPVYGPTPDYTYGSTTYDKGATVWHSIRGYLGDSNYYQAMHSLFRRNAFGNISSRQLQDSLFLYSGVDMSDFFAFHVFRPGFVDYILDSISSRAAGNQWQTTVTLRQKLYGSDGQGPVNKNRIPVTFFQGNKPFATRTMTFDGAVGQQTFTLDREPDYAVVDYYKTFSDAVTDDAALITEKKSYEMPLSHFKLSISSFTDTAFVHVAHHWGRADGEYSDSIIRNPGIVRMSNRYWVLTGNLPEGTKGKTYFRFAVNNSEYPYLDRGFYTRSQQADSLRLLYRRDCTQPWQVVETRINGNAAGGYLFFNELRLGQYTLAIVNEDLLGINTSEGTQKPCIFPNPSEGGLTFQLPGAEESLRVSVFDMSGRRIITNFPVTNGQTEYFSLRKGLYLFQISTANGQRVSNQKVLIK